MYTLTSYFIKALVVLMAVMMVFTMMPSMAWADGTEAGSNENSASNIVTSGNCGAENVTYTLYSDGRLAINGTGTTGAISKVLLTSKEKAQVTGITIEGNVVSIGKMVSLHR